MTAVQIRSTAAAFLTALSSPDAFNAWVDVRKDDKKAVGQFIAQTLGLAKAPSADDLIAIESAVLEMTGQAPLAMQRPRHVGFVVVAQQVADDIRAPRFVGNSIGVTQDAKAPRHVGFAIVAQQIAEDVHAPRHVGAITLTQQAQATLNDDQRRAVALGFLGALASPSVFEDFSAVCKTDRSAVAQFVRDAVGLAQVPAESDLAAIESIVQEILESQAPEVQAPRHVGFIVAVQQAQTPDVHAPRHVGFVVAVQQSHGEASLSEQQLQGIAAAFMDALKSTPSVFEQWIATPKNDASAIRALIAQTLGLATAPSADELEIMAKYIAGSLKPEIDKLIKQDGRVPRHVGVIFLAQQMGTENVTISDADLRELLELSALTAGD